MRNWSHWTANIKNCAISSSKKKNKNNTTKSDYGAKRPIKNTITKLDNLRSRIPEYKQKHSQYNIYANGITNTSDGTAILELSNNAKVYLETERMKKIAQMRRFVVDNQK